MANDDKLIALLTTWSMVLMGIVFGVFAAAILWAESPQLATAVGLALFLVTGLGGKFSTELVFRLMRMFFSFYELRQSKVDEVITQTEQKIDDVIRLSERDPRFGYQDMLTFPRVRRRNPIIHSARRKVWKAAWYMFPMGLMFTVVTGGSALVFKFVGIGYPNIVVATGAGLTMLFLLVAFGEPLFGHLQVLRKCRQMLRAADQVERRLGSGGGADA